MDNQKIQFIFQALLLLIIPFSSSGQTPVEFPELGLRFEIPEGWIGQETDNAYILGHQTIPGFVLMTIHTYSNLQDLEAEARQGLNDGQGTALSLSGDVSKYSDNGISANFEGTLQGQDARAYAIGLLSPHGGGINIIVASATPQFGDDQIHVADQVAGSVVFDQPVQSATTSTGDDVPTTAEEWKETLSGARLTYLTSYSSNTPGGGGYNQETVIDLCPQGFFNYRDTDVNAFGQYARMWGKERGGGTWEVEMRSGNPVLVLKFFNEQVYTYDLSVEDGKTFLNGYRYFRTYRNAPVEDHVPDCW